ncbi:MAG: putative DNA binding domain-containing protein [Candidatus Omnitrophica bacterium]|nr:putative DNA binding domain-containing protein [Candidatus Omnitrophota bacterium]
MKSKELLKLLNKDESATSEWKQSLSEIAEIIETASAFANTKGGRVFIGVSRTGKVAGVQIGKGTVENLANQISLRTDPKIHPHITVVRIKSKDVIVVEVKESQNKPSLALGKPYVRVGKSTMKMSKDDYETLILEKHKEKLQFDKQTCKGANLKDVDWGFVKKEFIPLYERVTGKKIVGTSKTILGSLGCIKNNKPTNAGILLFGKDPQKFFMNAYVALARYGTENVDVRRLDYKEFIGNLFQQIDSCNKYIKDNTAVMSRLEKGEVRRQDIPEYGWFSIRELVTNAVCHRDYSNFGTKVIIKMFSNRIEFYNPGGLSKGVTLKSIAKMQFSRNPIIAKILAKVEYIEELGEGWNKILEEHKAHPLKPKLPTVETNEYMFLVNIYSTKNKFAEKTDERLAGRLGERLGEKLGVKLGENEEKILRLIVADKFATIDSIAKSVRISTTAVENNLAKLKGKGVIRRIGPAKGGHWKVTK